MKPHLSVTQLAMLGKCGLQYQFRYLEGIVSPPGLAAVIGKGTHGGIESNLDAKRRTGSLLSQEEVEERTRDVTATMWDDEPPALTEDEQAMGTEKVRGDAIDTAVALAACHHQEIAPGIQPIALESRFRLELSGPYDLVGVKDIVEAGCIRDTKTAGKSPSGDEAQLSLQLTAYHLDETANGRRPDFVALDFLVKNKRPKAVTLTATRGPEDHARLLRRIELAAQTISSGNFLPSNPDNWWCSQRWCGFWDRCPFGSRKAVSVAISATPAQPVALAPGECGW